MKVRSNKMQVIPAEVILANLCAANLMTIKVYDLSQISRRLEAEFGGIYCEVDTDSVLYAITMWNDYFRWDYNKHIECLVKLNSAFTDKYFNWRIDKIDKNKFIKIIKDYVKE
jgi:hypothetical protein